MPIALPAIDLAALAGVMILMGLLVVVGYTFTKLADVLNFSVLGIHPLQHVATAINNTIVAGCNAGINTLDRWAIALWHGLFTAWNIFVEGLKDLANGTETAFKWVTGTAIPNVVNAAINPIKLDVTIAKNALESITGNIGALSSDFHALANGLDNTIARSINAWYRGIHPDITNEIHAAIHAMSGAVSGEISAQVGNAENLASSAIASLRTAETAVTDALTTAENATAKELRDLADSIPLTDIAAVAAAVPIIREMVRVLETETGLDNAICRQKVKGICGTNISSWESLLAGLAPLALAFSLREIVETARPIMRETQDIIERVA